MINIVQGNLLDAEDQYIAHQCNCITKKAAHLSFDVFQRFPYANIYATRPNTDRPGTIVIKGDGVTQRYVINMLGQYYPGKPKYPNSSLDGSKIREQYFHQCLLQIYKIRDLKSIAFPYKVGCGAAGGNWNNYLGTLENFSRFKDDAEVNLYCLTKEDVEAATDDYKAILPKMIKQCLGLK